MKHYWHFSEDELIAPSKICHQKSYSILYNCHAPTLVGGLHKMINDQTQAENLPEDVFVQLWNTIDTCDVGEGQSFTWLLPVTYATATDFLRRQEAIEPAEHLTLPDNTFSTPTTIATGVIESSTNDKDTRPDSDNRRVVDLTFFGEYSQQTVADTLKIVSETVKSHTQRTLQQLNVLSPNAL